MLRKRKEFSKFVSGVMQDSMVTGIPQIVAAESYTQKISRVFVFFMCIAGFIYQSLTFMDVYWKYDVIMDVRIVNPKLVERPSFTVCNFQGFKSQEICNRQDEPEIEKFLNDNNLTCIKITRNTYGNESDVCDCLPRFCDRYGELRNLSFVSLSESLKTMSWDEKKKWLVGPEEMVTSCDEDTESDFKNCSDKYYIRMSSVMHFSSCATFNSLIERPSHTLKEITSRGKIYLQVQHNGDNSNRDMKEPYSAISIHNKYTVINPIEDGYRIDFRREYEIRLRKIVKKLLPPPYTTNCMDYRSLWYARGGRGPTNFVECSQECQINVSLALHGCVMRQVDCLTQEPSCHGSILPDNAFYSEASDCADKNCSQACDEEYYTTTTVLSAEAATEIPCRNKTNNNNNVVSAVILKFDGMETTIYSYTPKYQEIEIYSNIGGYVGMWLGISLIAVCDFIESVVLMLNFPLRGWISNMARRKKTENITKN